jgi:SH3-like domain-containing protein
LSAALGAAALLLLGSLLAGEAGARSRRDGVVLAGEVVARKGDGTAYQSSFVDPLHAGTEFRLLEVRAGWYRIRLSDGRTAWIPSEAAELVRL